MKIPKCVLSKAIPFLWKISIEEIDKLELDSKPSFKERELRKFTEKLTEWR
ncbi:unnamed protein product [marine sediment metagenome]|uniref:Uncharacterized protein n=1 Tax=marine sediment metagenome TaxID=412755 RepID=X0TUA5_9ZZZZ